MTSSDKSFPHPSSLQKHVRHMMGKRYGSCTSELKRCTANIAGCVAFKYSWFIGPCRLPSLLLLPVNAMSICLISPWQRTTALAMIHLVRGKSALQAVGLSLRRHACKGSRLPVSSLTGCTWCCLCSCKYCTSMLLQSTPYFKQHYVHKE